VPEGTEFRKQPRQCDRPVVRDGRCICHVDDPDKELELLLTEISKLSHGGQEIDCSHFIFPKDFFRFPVALRTPTFFNKCKFYGDVSFQNQRVAAYVSFRNAHFLGQAIFGDTNEPEGVRTIFDREVDLTGTQFHKKVHFRSCEFLAEPVFQATIFHEGALFDLVHISWPHHVPLRFDHVEFRRDTTFRDLRITQNVSGLEFRHCNLEGLLLGSLEPCWDVVQLEHVSKWNESRRWYQAPRRKILDEVVFQSEPNRVVRAYQWLQRYFQKRGEYGLASDFYVGWMVGTGRDRQTTVPSRLTNSIYRLASKYGESIVRPGLWLFLVWFAIPLALLLVGTQVERVYDTGTAEEYAKYEIWDLVHKRQWRQLWSDYWSAFGASLAIGVIERRIDLQRPLLSVANAILVLQFLLNAVLIPLFILAVRRQVNQKRPSGS